MARFAALIVRTAGGLSCEGVAEGGEVEGLKDKFRELKLSGVIPAKSATKTATPISEMRLLYDGISGGVLKRHRKAL